MRCFGFTILAIFFALTRHARAPSTTEPESPLRDSTRRAPWLVAAAAYVLVPAATVCGCLLYISDLLAEQPVPTGSYFAFDVDTDAALAAIRDEIAIFNLTPDEGVVRAADPIEASNPTRVDVKVANCDSPASVHITVNLDPRWLMALKASAAHRATEITILRRINEPIRTRRIPKPAVRGRIGFDVYGRVFPGVRASMRLGEAVLPLKRDEAIAGTGRPVSSFTATVSPAMLDEIFLNEIVGTDIEIDFQADWVHARGFESCYIEIPNLIGNSSLMSIGNDGLDWGQSGAPAGPSEGIVSLSAPGLRVVSGASDPAPTSSLSPSWPCSKPSRLSSSLAPSQDCSAIAVLQSQNREVALQTRLLIAGALLAGAIVGVVTGVRRMLFRLLGWNDS